MKKGLVYLFCIFILSCGVAENQKVSNSGSIMARGDTTEKVSIVDNDSAICCCYNPPVYSYKTDMILSYSENSDFDSLLVALSSEYEFDTITSVSLVGFDSVPKIFNVFLNVERVVFQGSGGLVGLECFDKIKTVSLIESKISVNERLSWMNKIEYLFVDKTKFKSFDSLSYFPNLKELFIRNSGFLSSYPADIDSLKHITVLRLENVMNAKINLDDIDLRNLPCLKQVSMQTWHNSLVGVPKGIEDVELQKFEVFHLNLSEEEKQIVEKYRKGWR